MPHSSIGMGKQIKKAFIVLTVVVASLQTQVKPVLAP